MPRRFPCRIAFLVLACLPLAGIAVWLHLDHFLLTGRFFPIDIIENLSNPVEVFGMEADDLLLKDGRRVTVSLLHGLSAYPIAFREITKRGVEVGTDGLAIALVRVHHWCGNDPVRDHLVRINIADLLRYLLERDGNAPLNNDGDLNFSHAGLNATEYSGFKGWIGIMVR